MRLLVEVVEARWTATGHGDGSNDTFSAGEGRAGSGNVGGSNDGDDGSGSDEQGGREEGNASGNPARIARASSLAATHTSGTSELVSPACVPDLTYTHTWTSFFGAGALCLRAAFSCTRTVCLRLAVAHRLHVYTARSRSALFQEPLSVHAHISLFSFLLPFL